MNTLDNEQTKTTKFDVSLLVITVILCIFSILAVYSAVGNLAYTNNQSTGFFLTKQLLLVFIGLTMMFLIARLNYFDLAKTGRILIFVSIILLIYTMFWGLKINGARRLISVFGLTFQPSDFAKIALIIYISGWIEKYKSRILSFDLKIFSELWPVLVLPALIFPNNLSTAALMFTISMIILFLMKVHSKYYFGLIGVSIMGLVLIFSLNAMVPFLHRAEDSTWENRIDDYFSPKPTEVNPDELSQKDYLTIAVATGGIIGKMPGKSSMRIFIANGFSDFIYAIIIEEYGLIGGVFIVLLFLVFLYRSIRIAMKSNSDFGVCLAIGISAMIIIQAFMHMGISVGLLPVTGQTLPLVSMGGTSMWFMLIAIGLLQSIYFHKTSENENLNINLLKQNA